VAKKRAKTEKTGSRAKPRVKPDWAPRFLEAVRREGTIFHAARIAGIERTNVYARRDRDEEFARELARALEDSTDGLEREAIRRGSEGYDEPVIYQGQLMGVWRNPDGTEAAPDTPGARFVPLCVRRYSDALLGNLIKWRRYADKIEHSGPEGKPLQITTVEIVRAPLSAPAVEALPAPQVVEPPPDSTSRTIEVPLP